MACAREAYWERGMQLMRRIAAEHPHHELAMSEWVQRAVRGDPREAFGRSSRPRRLQPVAGTATLSALAVSNLIGYCAVHGLG